jgi:hypothetical protein
VTGMMPAAPIVPAALRLDPHRARALKGRLSRLLDHVAGSPGEDEVRHPPSPLPEHVGFITEAFAISGGSEVLLDRSLRRHLRQA